MAFSFDVQRRSCWNMKWSEHVGEFLSTTDLFLKTFGAFWLKSFGGFLPPITKDFLSYWRHNKTLRHINIYLNYSSTVCSSSFLFFGNMVVCALRLKLLSYCNNTESMHCKDTKPKIWNKCSQERNCAATVQIPTFMFLWAIYIFPRSALLFSCRRIGRPIRGIYV